MNFVIGDVHGMLEELETVVSKIDKADNEAQIYCVGDFCDRGYNSKGVVDFILGAKNIQYVSGNHDCAMNCILSGKATAYCDDQSSDAPLATLHNFLYFGMYETLLSYGIEREDVRNAKISYTSPYSIRSRRNGI